MNRFIFTKNKGLIVFLIINCIGTSQTENQKGFWKNHKHIWLSGFNYKNHTIPFWCTALTTIALSVKDEEIYRNIKQFQNRNPSINKPSKTITLLGDGYVDISILGVFFLKGLLLNDHRATKTASLGFKGMLHTGIVVQVLKHVTGRQRPGAGKGKDHWHGPSGALKRYNSGRWALYDAFPSGHTMAAWSLATVVSHQYAHLKHVPALAYALAIGAGLSRITEDTHWASDVFLGAVLGYEITRQIIQIESSETMAIYPKRNGIQIVYIF